MQQLLDDKQRLAPQEAGVKQGSFEDGSESLVVDGFVVPTLDAPDDEPPAYGEHHDQVRFSQAGFEAGAAVTDDGRVNININTKNRRLADLLAPAIDRQLVPDTLPPAYIPSSLSGHDDKAPPPPLNVVVQIVGSRGDVQPFVSLGKVLKTKHGHRVRIATHATFQGFVEENGLEFFNIGGDPAELMAFMVKYPGLMPGIDALKSGEICKRRKGIQDMILGCWRSCIEAGNGLGPPPTPHGRNEPLDLSAGMPGDGSQQPFVADAIIANPPSFAHIHVAEKLGIPLHMMFTMPWSPTRAFPHPLANVQSSNADDVLTNYLTYTLVEMMTWQGLGDVINRFRDKVLGLSPLCFISAPGLLTRLKIPYTYCWSPSLIPKPNDWSINIDIAGFFFLDLASSFTPDAELEAFLRAGPPPVYIGFGSIVVDDADAMTRMIFDAIRLAGVRALVSKGWGGLGAENMDMPANVLMLGNVPHDWLFQRVSCVVHHGGAGTTAAGIKAGKPTVVVPFFGDQPFWGSMIAKAKAGPEPIRYKALTAEELAAAIRLCLEPETQQRAQALGSKIRQEHGSETGAQSFHSHLDVESLRCSVAPSRTAAWRVRRTKFRLSALAAAVLVEQGLIDYTDVKLHRPHEYHTEDQPSDPISAGACSLVGDMSTIGMAIADMPREIFRSGQRAADKSLAASSISGSTTPRLESRHTDSSIAEHLIRAAPAPSSSSSMKLPSESASPSTSQSSLTSPTGATSIDDGTEDRHSLRKATLTTSQTKQKVACRDSLPIGVGIGAALGAGRGVGRAVSTGVKSPMNFCLGLAKGFRNMPRLYHDETIRPVEKVTDFSSGVKIAGKELGYGFFDGIAGLVTQPLRGAEKEGAGGFVKGFGKGIGGLITKPAAGIWGLPAYMMQGVHAEINKLFATSVHNYILTSRIVQGRQELKEVTPQEKADIVNRWNSAKNHLENFYSMKRKQKSRGRDEQASTESRFARHKARWREHSRRSSVQDKGNLQRRAGAEAAVPPPSSRGLSIQQPMRSHEMGLEEAIEASVRETSRGDAAEDSAVESAIRQSIQAMQQRGALGNETAVTVNAEPQYSNVFEEDEWRITDEEYQNLIQQAIERSLSRHVTAPTRQGGLVDSKMAATEEGGPDADRPGLSHYDGDAALERAMEESTRVATPHSDNEEEEELQRAIAASREDMKRTEREQTEEQVVLEYIKKQSLVEEEYRHKMNNTRDKGVEEEREREDLRRALEESMRQHDRQDGP
ncbi:hypothetical protein CDD81_4498 [Ophiocordyceps australis]|uniref:Uncharacterized protein n=1 Tax=Ophiocordyceps australis TaxID=1399860 RepID=A0A2C5YHK6_9HYPO|nr:hypothetical protein CDD81_4498 [Ophiocordyceps australis]